MFGLTTTQLLLLAAAAFWLFFMRSPGGGWLDIIRKFLGGGTEDIVTKLISEFFKCAKCTAEEEKKVEEALAVMVNHVIKHRLMQSSEPDTEARLRVLEDIVARSLETKS